MEKSIALLVIIVVCALGILIAYANVPLEEGPIIIKPSVNVTNESGAVQGNATNNVIDDSGLKPIGCGI